MNAVFTNASGDKQNFLYQYDKGQTLVVENLEYTGSDFSNYFRICEEKKFTNFPSGKNH